MERIIYVYQSEVSYCLRIIPPEHEGQNVNVGCKGVGCNFPKNKLNAFADYVSDVFYNLSEESSTLKIRNEKEPSDSLADFRPINPREMMLIYASIELNKKRHP